MNRSIGFAAVVALLWQRRRSIVCVVVAAAVAGVVIAIALPPRYEADVVLMPAEAIDSQNGLDSLGARLSDLGDLAGLESSPSGGAELEKSIAVLLSREFTDRFLQEENALPALFPDRWDKTRMTWKKVNPGFVSTWRTTIEERLHMMSPIEGSTTQNNGAPSLWDAFKRFDRIRGLNRDRKTGMITVSIRWRDPEEAARWANQLVARVNEELRTRALDDATRSTEYLEEQLQKTSQVEIRDALFHLSEMEQRKAMLAHVRRDYAFEVVDPAVPPRERVSPKRTLLVVGFVIVGFLLGIITVLAQIMLLSERGRRR